MALSICKHSHTKVTVFNSTTQGKRTFVGTASKINYAMELVHSGGIALAAHYLIKEGL